MSKAKVEEIIDEVVEEVATNPEPPADEPTGGEPDPEPPADPYADVEVPDGKKLVLFSSTHNNGGETAIMRTPTANYFVRIGKVTIIK